MTCHTDKELRLAEELETPIGQLTLHGELKVPKYAVGLVVFAHGSGSGRRSPRNQAVATALRKYNLGTLLFDLLTRSEEAEDRYTGHLRFNIPFLGERLEQVTSSIANDERLAGLPIGFFGASTGAAAAIVAAARLPRLTAAVVSRGGRPDLATDSLADVQCPVLLIVGECDETVLEMNQAAFKKLRVEKGLKIVPRATHLFEEPGALETVSEMAADWFRKAFQARS